ncbi:hypothetical protein ACFBZI_11615 [Moraxella sp. ZJ142]|uniref:hypothetical protein n=1 Tax=Moraxella marmotae TaxID=3344520 RepID=UPI0035D462B0
MADYVKTIVYFQGSNENIQRMLNDLNPQKTGFFTLDKAIPMPAELRDRGLGMTNAVVVKLLSSTDDDLTIESTKNRLNFYQKQKLYDLGIDPQTTIGDAKKQIREIPELAEHVALFDKYGACDWYEWAKQNIGTESFDAKFSISTDGKEKDCICIKGETKYKVPEPLIKELAKRYDVQADGYTIDDPFFHVGRIRTIDNEVKFAYYHDVRAKKDILKEYGVAEKYSAYFD